MHLAHQVSAGGYALIKSSMKYKAPDGFIPYRDKYSATAEFAGQDFPSAQARHYLYPPLLLPPYLSRQLVFCQARQPIFGYGILTKLFSYHRENESCYALVFLPVNRPYKQAKMESGRGCSALQTMGRYREPFNRHVVTGLTRHI